MLISPSWGTKRPRPGPAREVPGGLFSKLTQWGKERKVAVVLEKPLICTELQQALAHTNPARIFRNFVLLGRLTALSKVTL